LSRRAANAWMRLGFDAWSLGAEASTVMGLRAMKMAAGGPAAETEARKMVAEKIAAGLQLQALAMTGGLGATPQRAARATMAHYRRKVVANRRRLQKP
jgi:hypothetical protein